MSCRLYFITVYFTYFPEHFILNKRYIIYRRRTSRRRNASSYYGAPFNRNGVDDALTIDRQSVSSSERGRVETRKICGKYIKIHLHIYIHRFIIKDSNMMKNCVKKKKVKRKEGIISECYVLCFFSVRCGRWRFF